MKYVIYFKDEHTPLPKFVQQLSGPVTKVGSHESSKYRNIWLGVVEDGSDKLTDVFVELDDLAGKYPEADMVECAGRLLTLWRTNEQTFSPLMTDWLWAMYLAKELMEGIPVTSISMMVVEGKGIAFQLMSRSFL